MGIGPGLHKKNMNWVLVFIAPSLLSYRADIKYTFTVIEMDKWGWKRRWSFLGYMETWPLVFDLEFGMPLIFISADG